MKGIHKIVKREASRIIRQHGFRRRKKLNRLKRWYLLDKSELKIQGRFFDLRTREGKYFQATVENKLRSLYWHGFNVGDEVKVGVGERQSKAEMHASNTERKIGKMLSRMLAVGMRLEGLKP